MKRNLLSILVCMMLATVIGAQNLKDDATLPVYADGFAYSSIKELGVTHVAVKITETCEVADVVIISALSNRDKKAKNKIKKMIEDNIQKPATINGEPVGCSLCYLSSYDTDICEFIEIDNVTDAYRFYGGWQLTDVKGEAAQSHPCLRGLLERYEISINMKLEILVCRDSDNPFICGELRLMDNGLCELGEIKGRYSMNKKSDAFTIYYNDADNKERKLKFVRYNSRERLVVPPPPQTKRITEFIEIVDDEAKIK